MFAASRDDPIFRPNNWCCWFHCDYQHFPIHASAFGVCMFTNSLGWRPTSLGSMFTRQLPTCLTRWMASKSSNFQNCGNFRSSEVTANSAQIKSYISSRYVHVLIFKCTGTFWTTNISSKRFLNTRVHILSYIYLYSTLTTPTAADPLTNTYFITHRLATMCCNRCT